jgi:exportin-2 (importin alpha re-exporter)
MLIVTPDNALCYSFFLPAVNTLPVLIADSIKYVMIFRSVLPREVVVGSIPQLVRHLTAYSHVVHTYAACAIEKILVMKAPDGSAM